VNVLTNDLLYIPLRANGVCVRCRFNIFFWLCTPGFVSHSTRRGVPDNSNYAATALDPSGEDDVELLHVSAGNILKNLHWPIAVHISEKIQYFMSCKRSMKTILFVWLKQKTKFDIAILCFTVLRFAFTWYCSHIYSHTDIIYIICKYRWALWGYF